jgi:hypothetical protein
MFNIIGIALVMYYILVSLNFGFYVKFYVIHTINLNFGVKLSEDGVNGAETCRSNIRIYFYVSNVHFVVW